jgi:hypothetical protein
MPTTSLICLVSCLTYTVIPREVLNLNQSEVGPKPLECTLLIQCLKVMQQSNKAKTALLYNDKLDLFWITYPQITCCCRSTLLAFVSTVYLPISAIVQLVIVASETGFPFVLQLLEIYNASRLGFLTPSY